MVEVYLSEDAVKDRRRLGPHQEGRLIELARALSQDVTLGDKIRQVRIPRALKHAYHVNNLWRLELPDSWRLLYTVQTRSGEKTTVSILRILDHRSYDRMFGYHTS